MAGINALLIALLQAVVADMQGVAPCRYQGQPFSKDRTLGVK
jgi:hypothetical protein